MSKSFVYDRFDVALPVGMSIEEAITKSSDGVCVLAEDAINRDAVLKAEIQTLQAQLKEANQTAEYNFRLYQDLGAEVARTALPQGWKAAPPIMTAAMSQAFVDALKAGKPTWPAVLAAMPAPEHPLTIMSSGDSKPSEIAITHPVVTVENAETILYGLLHSFVDVAGAFPTAKMDEPLAKQATIYLRPSRCDRAPEGWHCSRDKGHAGPCAAHPDDRDDNDVIARSKRILALVDTYVERQTATNRSELRHQLHHEFSTHRLTDAARDVLGERTRQVSRCINKYFCIFILPEQVNNSAC